MKPKSPGGEIIRLTKHLYPLEETTHSGKQSPITESQTRSDECEDTGCANTEPNMCEPISGEPNTGEPNADEPITVSQPRVRKPLT